MIKTKLSNVVYSISGLQILVDKPLKAKTAYRIKRIMDAVTSENVHVEKARNALVLKYADKQTKEEIEKKLPLTVKTKIKEFHKEFEQLLDEEVELNCHKIPFSDIENIELSVQNLAVLEPWFDIPEEAPILAERKEDDLPSGLTKEEAAILNQEK